MIMAIIRQRLKGQLEEKWVCQTEQMLLHTREQNVLKTVISPTKYLESYSAIHTCGIMLSCDSQVAIPGLIASIVAVVVCSMYECVSCAQVNQNMVQLTTEVCCSLRTKIGESIISVWVRWLTESRNTIKSCTHTRWQIGVISYTSFAEFKTGHPYHNIVRLQQVNETRERWTTM